MKIGVYADPHFSQNSSILSGSYGEFSGRLNNLIESFTWMNSFFKEKGCEMIFCLGDLTDRPDLTAEEITAISRCQINSHYLIVGNHCRSDKSGKVNSLSVFKNVYYEPTILEVGDPICRILLLPFNSDIKDLSSYKNIDIILSHNDLLGYDFGRFVSDKGYSIQSILENSKLFVNGHLHNGGWMVKDRIANLGQMSGMNFSSCGGQWEPSVGIIDTDTFSLSLYENPVALRFKKEEFKALSQLKNYLDNLKDQKGFYVLQAKVSEKMIESSRSLINKCQKVVASRLLVKYDKVSSEKRTKEIVTESSSIYDKLRKFIKLQDSSKYDSKVVEDIIKSLEVRGGSL